MTKLAAIWAQDSNGILGSGTAMSWHVPADFRHFKDSTMDCPIIMGRRSWEALGKALPGRTNIVITRTPGYEAAGALVVSSPGSRGGALDTLEVVTPLLGAIFHQLDEQR